jgi:DNA-binding transcriptional LysR family regulator
MEGGVMPWNDRIERRLKLKDLRTLMAVMETGGIGKAAGRLNYSQPAVSQAIANLERTLGKRLLERGRRGIESTAYGEALLKCGIAVFDDLRKGVEEIDFISDPTSGEVRIGCSEPISAGLLSEVIDRVARRYPRIVVHAVPGQPPELIRDLDARKVDFVLAQSVGRAAGPRHQVEVLYHEPVLVVAGLHHPYARRRRVRLADLVNQAWVLPPPTSFVTTLVAEAFRAAGLDEPRISVIGSHLHLRLTLVSRGRFLTVVPAIMLRSGARQMSIKRLPVELPGNRRPVGIVSLKDRAPSPAAQLFIQHTRAIARTMAKA